MMDTAAVAAAVHGRLRGGNVRFSRVTTDTRALAAGDLFVALAGERFDGHDFLSTAAVQGVTAAMIARARASALPSTLPGILVDDPRRAFGDVT